MRTVTSANRTAYLSGNVTPTFRATLRQLRLEFQDGNGYSRPLVYNTYNIIDAGVYASDGKEGRVIWGDSCTLDTDIKVRLINKCAWGDTADYFLSFTQDGTAAANWDYSDIANPSTTPDANCRVGLYPSSLAADIASFFVWYASGNSVYRETLSANVTSPTWGWAGRTGTGQDISTPGFDALAIHPVSTTEAFAVGFQDHYLWVQYLKHNGSDWTGSGSSHVVWSSQNLESGDAFFSDAEDLDGAGKFLIVVNLGKHGAAHSIVYNSATDLYSQPYPVLSGGGEDTETRMTCAGLSSINSRVWAVTYRAAEGSDSVPYAYHTALASTADGRHWRDEDFVGTHMCWGKLLYASGDDDCYVVGNACVFKGTASNKLGNDIASLKKTITEADAWSLSVPRYGSAATIESSMMNVGDALSGSDLLRSDNELILELGISGGAYDTLFTAYLAQRSRTMGYSDPGRYEDTYRIGGRGPLYKLAGEGAYQPVGGKIYQSPTAWYSSFHYDKTGLAKQSLATVKGSWTTEKPSDKAEYALKGMPGRDRETAIATVPRSFSSPWLTLTTHFKPLRQLLGTFIVFLYEDEDNYWRAGLLDDAGTMKLVIDQISSGNVTNKASSSATGAGTGAWYSFYFDLTPETARLYWCTSWTDDFGSPAATVSYTLTTESEGLPLPYHIGLSVLDRPDESYADIDNGIVTKSFARQIQDENKDFTSSVLSKFLHYANDWRTIVDYTVVYDEDLAANIALTVDTPWSKRPIVGEEWGIYSTKGDPYCLFADVSWCDGLPAWTVDDITNDILAMSGVGRTSVYSQQLTAMASGTGHYRDVDVSVSSSISPELIVHASATANYTGLTVALDDDYHYLYHSYQGSNNLMRKRPNLIALDMSAEPDIRIVISGENIYLYADYHYVGCFEHIGTTGAGYIATSDSGTYTITEFGALQESFVWGPDEGGNPAIGRLMRGRHAKMVERANGTVSISEYITRDDLGTYSTPLVTRGEVIVPAPSIVELFGAEVRTYFIEPELARYGLRFRRSDNPTVITEAETLQEARLMTKLAREAAEGENIMLYAADPAIEIEDTVTVNGTEYIVSSYATQLRASLDRIAMGTRATLRLKVDDPATSNWGTAVWGQFYLG